MLRVLLPARGNRRIRPGSWRWSWAGHILRAWLETARQRRRLIALDERALRDVGIDRLDVRRETNRRFWDVPDHLKLRDRV